MNLYQIFRPLIFKLDAETAHNLAINFLKYFPNLATSCTINKQYKNLQQNLWGLDFKSPLGMAAGFDKNAEAVKALQQFGFGFVEVGTVTPKAQTGNDKPRLFRLAEDQAIINRLGFNNKGAEVFAKNIENLFYADSHSACRNSCAAKNHKNAVATKNLQHKSHKNILGINIGKNKDTENAISDYILLLEKFYEAASYITVNISSPNTKNLRDLQKEDQLDLFLSALMSKKNELEKLHNKKTPIWLKVAPDLTIEEQKTIATIALKNKIDALIISNTTISRSENLKSKNAQESGGLSGQPLFEKSNEVLKNFYRFTEGQIALVGVGGITNAQDAYTKIKCGASLVQIYSGLIYQGFGAVEKITKELSELVKKDGLENISQARGSLAEN
ncbi:MAG: dihydroorotate dehydrogenase (quinone) [Rickettsiales bacterium]|nr:dihydroorotate dehydrogenase (quinone) [Rickettsiales bacterium]